MCCIEYKILVRKAKSKVPLVPQGQIYMLNPTLSDITEKVLDVQSSNFLTAAPLHTDTNICVVKYSHCSGIKVSCDCMCDLSHQTEMSGFLLVAVIDRLWRITAMVLRWHLSRVPVSSS